MEIKESYPIYLDQQGDIINIGDLVRYTHDESSLGVVIVFDPARRGGDPVKVHWQNAMERRYGEGLNGRAWFVNPANIIKINVDNGS